MNDVRTFGEWLKDTYEDAGMTQAEFSERAGVGQSTVSAWVGDKQPPNDRNCIRIANALGIDPNEVRVRAGRKPRRQAPVPPGVGLSSEDIAGLEAKLDEVIRRLDRLTAERERDDDHK